MARMTFEDIPDFLFDALENDDMRGVDGALAVITERKEPYGPYGWHSDHFQLLTQVAQIARAALARAKTAV